MTDPVARLRPYASLIRREAEKYGLAPHLLAGLIWFESGGQPAVRSAAGAVGLGQVMPREAGFRGRPTAKELEDPATNIAWSARILSDGVKRWGSVPQGLAAYLGTIDAKGNVTGKDPYTGVTGNQYVQRVLAAANDVGERLLRGTARTAEGAGPVEPTVSQRVERLQQDVKNNGNVAGTYWEGVDVGSDESDPLITLLMGGTGVIRPLSYWEKVYFRSLKATAPQTQAVGEEGGRAMDVWARFERLRVFLASDDNPGWSLIAHEGNDPHDPLVILRKPSGGNEERRLSAWEKQFAFPAAPAVKGEAGGTTVEDPMQGRGAADDPRGYGAAYQPEQPRQPSVPPPPGVAGGGGGDDDDADFLAEAPPAVQTAYRRYKKLEADLRKKEEQLEAVQAKDAQGTELRFAEVNELKQLPVDISRLRSTVQRSFDSFRIGYDGWQRTVTAKEKAEQIAAEREERAAERGAANVGLGELRGAQTGLTEEQTRKLAREAEAAETPEEAQARRAQEEKLRGAQITVAELQAQQERQKQALEKTRQDAWAGVQELIAQGAGPEAVEQAVLAAVTGVQEYAAMVQAQLAKQREAHEEAAQKEAAELAKQQQAVRESAEQRAIVELGGRVTGELALGAAAQRRGSVEDIVRSGRSVLQDLQTQLPGEPGQSIGERWLAQLGIRQSGPGGLLQGGQPRPEPVTPPTPPPATAAAAAGNQGPPPFSVAGAAATAGGQGAAALPSPPPFTLDETARQQLIEDEQRRRQEGLVYAGAA